MIERFPDQEFHGDVRDAAVFADFVKAHDMIVVEFRQRKEVRMLVLTKKLGEKIVMSNNITMQVLSIGNRVVRPKEVQVLRRKADRALVGEADPVVRERCRVEEARDRAALRRCPRPISTITPA